MFTGIYSLPRASRLRGAGSQVLLSAQHTGRTGSTMGSAALLMFFRVKCSIIPCGFCLVLDPPQTPRTIRSVLRLNANAKKVEEYLQHCQDGHREDHAEEPRNLSPGDDSQEDQD